MRGKSSLIETMSCNLSLTTYTESAKGCIKIIIISKFLKVFHDAVEKKIIQGTKNSLNQTGFHIDPNVLISIKTSLPNYPKI